MGNVTVHNDFDDVLNNLRGEFLTDARDRLDVIERAVFEASGDTITVLRRETHNIKGMAGTFGFPMVGLLAHRLEDYAAQIKLLDDDNRHDIDVFLRLMQDILQVGHDPDEADAAALIRSLPVRAEAESAVPIEVLLVCPSRATARFALKDLGRLGCRVTTAGSAPEAMELAVRARPDLLITSAVLNGIDGIDLARALGAMSATAQLPVAVLTSFEDNHPALLALPEHVVVLHPDRGFGERVAGLIAQVIAA